MSTKRQRIEQLVGKEKAEKVMEIFSEFQPRTMEQVTFRHIVRTLEYFEGNRRKSANALEIGQQTLANKIDQIIARGIEVPPTQSRYQARWDENRTSGAV